MQAYKDLLQRILTEGLTKSDRTGVGTISIFGAQLVFDLADGFPIVTEKKILWDKIVWELAWMLRGDGNVKWLNEKNVHIWDAWADENGDLGKVYGPQWRHFGSGFDQITAVIEQIKTNPHSRRHIVTAWDPEAEANLPPCHIFYQFYVNGDKLDCQVYFRSNDVFLGMPFNICQYALLLSLIAKVTGYIPGRLVYTIGDAHLYLNHLDQVNLLLSREPKPLPQLELTADIDSLSPETAKLIGYESHPFIKAPIAV